jgi:hypothetical protein
MRGAAMPSAPPEQTRIVNCDVCRIPRACPQCRPASASATRLPNGSCRANCPLAPDARSYTGSTAGLAADAEFAERSGGDFAAERRARDAERQRRKRVGAGDEDLGSR